MVSVATLAIIWSLGTASATLLLSIENGGFNILLLVDALLAWPFVYVAIPHSLIRYYFFVRRERKQREIEKIAFTLAGGDSDSMGMTDAAYGRRP